MDDKKKYNFMENVLTEINSKFISLPDEDVKRNNKILSSVLNSLIDKMKEENALFKSMYTRVFYGGSYYDGLRVGKPEEFDLDLLLVVPKYADPVLTTSNMPGYVHLQLKNYDGWMKQPESNKQLVKLFDEKHYLDTQKVLAWMEGVLQKALNNFPLDNSSRRILKSGNEEFKVKVIKGGPALTLKVEGSSVKMDVDLVTCFVFSKDKWPQNGFKPNPVKNKPDFFIVPKKPRGGIENKVIPRYWRLSFQEQERVLIDGKRTLKPTIKLLKKLRDNLQHDIIASYYIKTAVLHIADSKPEDFWRNSLSYVFMTVLKEYKDCFEKCKIPYYWNKNNNLIGAANPTALQNINNRLKIVIADIEKKTDEPTTVAKYLLNSMEYKLFMMSRLNV